MSKAPHGFGARGRDCDGDLGGFVFDGIEPMRIGVRLFEQAVARAQRTLQRVDAARMRSVDREHEPVEETPALGRGSGEQGIHRRRHPDDADVIRECSG